MSARRRNGRKRTTSPRHPLSGLNYAQPYIGFSAQVGIKPFKKGQRRTILKLSCEGSCREELLYDTLHQMKRATFNRRKIARSWETRETKIAHLDLDDPRTKQPGLTYLYSSDFDGDFAGICQKPCCVAGLIHFLDATVGQVGVLFDPDWYRGNWWETRPEDNNRNNRRSRNDGGEFRYYGVSNAFLRHPTLQHTILGLFRQALLTYLQDKSSGALERLDRGDVERALREGDPRLAWRNLQKIRRWIEMPQSGDIWPFPRGYWGRLQHIYRAIYRHGYDKLFAGDVESSWQINDKGEADIYGAWDYWGARRVTVAGRRLAKLGK